MSIQGFHGVLLTAHLLLLTLAVSEHFACHVSCGQAPCSLDCRLIEHWIGMRVCPRATFNWTASKLIEETVVLPNALPLENEQILVRLSIQMEVEEFYKAHTKGEIFSTPSPTNLISQEKNVPNSSKLSLFGRIDHLRNPIIPTLVICLLMILKHCDECWMGNIEWAPHEVTVDSNQQLYTTIVCENKHLAGTAAAARHQQRPTEEIK